MNCNSKFNRYDPFTKFAYTFAISPSLILYRMTSADRQSLNSIQRKKGGDVVCQYHDDAHVVMFCKTCDQLVCDECIKSSHKPHDLEAINKQALEDKAQLSSQIPLVKNTTIPGLKEHIKSIGQTKDKSVKDFEQLANKIVTRTNDLIRNIEKSRDHMLQLCRRDQEKARTFLTELEENMTNGIEALEQSLSAAEEVVKTGSSKAPALIQSRLRLHWDIQEFKKRHAQIEIPEFISGSSYDNSIEQMIGVFSGALHLKTSEELLSKNLLKGKPFSTWKVRPTLMAVLPLKYDIRSASSVKSDTMLMVPVTRKRLLITMSSNGRTRETEMAEHRIYDMSHSIGNEFIATDADSKTIFKFKLDGTVVDKKELRSIPRGIHVCKNGDILMCQCDSVDFKTIRSRPKIVRMDEKMRPIESGDLNNVEYTIPDRIVENSNGDICIIDRTGGGNSRLLVLNKDGSLKFVYPNESEYDYIPNSPTKKISLSDVCCDTFSNIFVADEKNNEDIILNSNGDEVVRFSKLLKKKGHLNIVAPSQIVIDRTGRLWIVMQGKVLVFDLYS